MELRNCTVIEGSLLITWIVNDVTPSNYTNVVLPNLREITGFLLLFRVNGLTTLGQLFPNLRVIRAVDVFYGYGIVIYEVDDLQSISLPKLSYLGHGVIAANNPQLCFLHMPDWSVIRPVSEDPPVVGYRNGGTDACRLIEGCSMACDSYNSDDKGRCWDMDTCQEGNVVAYVTDLIGVPPPPSTSSHLSFCVAMCNLWSLPRQA